MVKLMSLPQLNELTIRQDFEVKVLNGPFEVCDLGSCQYSVIQHMINFLLEWDKVYNDVELMFEDLGFNVSYKKIEPLDEVIWNMIDYVEFKDTRGDKLGMIYLCEKTIKLCKAESFDDLFIGCRTSAWDLWTAASTISQCTFEDLNIELSDKAPTYGPIMNQRAQDQGLENGIQCFLLLKHELVKSFESFADFDT